MTKIVILGIFSSAGQSCVAGSRLLVQRTVYEDVLSRLVQLTNELTIGPPDREGTKVGPLASLAHRDRIEAWIAEARRDGADIVAGGRRPGGEVFEQGAYYCPTVIAGIDSTHELCQRELFGPVLCALPFEDEQEAVALANGTRFGLAAGVWTRDYSRAWRITRSLEAGTVWINTYKQLSIAAPFGGFKHSGLGREKGPRGIRIYQQAKSVYLGLHETPSPWAVGSLAEP